MLDDRLLDLLAEWEEAREAGRDRSPQDLCPDDLELQRELAARIERRQWFLASHESRTTAGDETSSLGAGSPAPAVTAGRFRPVHFHAQGGLGEIHVAADDELPRQVALKRIRPGRADDPMSRARFLREAELTSLLEHPGIIPVYGLVNTPEGAPCYAMRFVAGDSLKDAIDRASRRKPSPEYDRALRQLLNRFIAVCQAIAFAHSKGVIHRDIKPANVMLGEFGETYVVDWGLAKRIDGNHSRADIDLSSSADTGTGNVVGTPAYMAPEQARGESSVGPASDIYSLGATLYHILDGRPPFDQQSPDLIVFKLQTDEAPAPTRNAPPSLAAVCRKAMAIRPANRYAAAADLAADVERWLADEPVTARQEPFKVRAGRWMRKHPGFAGSIAAALLVGIMGLGIGLYFVKAEKNRTEAAKFTAEQNLAFAKKGNELLGSVFAGLDPKKNYATVGEFSEALKANLSKAVQQLEGSSIGDPLTVAEMQNTLGLSLLHLGALGQAVAVFEKSRDARAAGLGRDHPNTLITMGNLAGAYEAAGRNKESLQIIEEVLKSRRVRLGPDHFATLMSINDLASGYQTAGQFEKAVLLYEEAHELLKAKLGPDHADTLMSMDNLASGYQAAGRMNEALPLFEKALKLMRAKLGPDDPDTLTCLGNLARCYWDADRLDLALPLFEETYQRMKAKFGPEHFNTLTGMNNLASGYMSARQIKKALPLYEDTLKLRKRLMGFDHPQTLTSMNNLAFAYMSDGRIDQALPLYEEACKLWKEKFGPDHSDTLTCMSNLASCLELAGRIEMALPTYEFTLNRRIATLGPDHPDSLVSMARLARALHKLMRTTEAISHFDQALSGFEKLQFRSQHASSSIAAAISIFEEIGDWPKAESWRRKWLTVVKQRFGAESVPYAAELTALGLNLIQQQKWAEAESHLRESIAIRESKEPDAWTTFNSKSVLGAALMGQKKYAEAEPLLVAGHAGLKQRRDTIPGEFRLSRLTEATERLIKLAEESHKPDDAARWKNELSAIRKSADPKSAGSPQR